MNEQTKLKLAQAYAKAMRTSLYGRKPELSDQHYKELKNCNANSVFDNDEAIYIERSKLWNDADQTRTLCQLIDEAEKIISSNLRVSKPLPFDYYDKGMFTAFVIAQAMTEGLSQEERDAYFEKMIEDVKQRQQKGNVR